jgi:hypothetical protein
MECAMCEGAIKNVNIDAEAKIRKALQLWSHSKLQPQFHVCVEIEVYDLIYSSFELTIQ